MKRGNLVKVIKTVIKSSLAINFKFLSLWYINLQTNTLSFEDSMLYRNKKDHYLWYKNIFL